MLIKIRFIRNGEPKGREYAYRAPDNVKVGDMVELPSGKGVVTQIGLTMSMVGCLDDVKDIVGKVEDSHETESV